MKAPRKPTNQSYRLSRTNKRATHGQWDLRFDRFYHAGSIKQEGPDGPFFYYSPGLGQQERVEGTVDTRDEAKQILIDANIAHHQQQYEESMVHYRKWKAKQDEMFKARRDERAAKLRDREAQQTHSRDELTQAMSRCAVMNVKNLLDLNKGTADSLELYEELLTLVYNTLRHEVGMQKMADWSMDAKFDEIQSKLFDERMARLKRPESQN